MKKRGGSGQHSFEAQPASGSRPAAVLLSPEAPYPAAGGGALRTASLLEYLARRYTLDLIVFREPGAPDPAISVPAGLLRDVRVIPLPAHSRGVLARSLRNLGRLMRGTPPLNDRFGGFADAVSACLAGRRYELAVIEHFWCAPYAAQLTARKTLLNLHNIESVLYQRCAEAERPPLSFVFRRFGCACLAMERRWFPRFSALLAASAPDAARVRQIAPGCRVQVYPNAIPLVPEPAVEEVNEIVFSGNLEYHPNVSAVRFFRDRIWPILRERSPELVWRIVGKNPEGVRSLVRSDSRIKLVGPVANAVQMLASAAVVVVPLLAGSGTRVKILEAWAAGRPVVSTSIGAEGLPAGHGEHLLLADTPQEFADSVLLLLRSPELRRKLGRAGRALYEREFTWPAAWKRLEELGI